MATTLECSTSQVPSTEPDRSSGRWSWRQALLGAAILATWRGISHFTADTVDAWPDVAWAALGVLLPLAWMLLYPLWAARENDAEVSIAPGPENSLAGDVGVGLASGLAAVTAIYGLSALYYWLTGEVLGSAADAALGNGFRAVVVILIAFTLTPIAEELFFRGLLLDAGKRQCGWSTALLGQALFFALVHDGTWLQCALRFLLGLALGGLALGRRSLIPGMVMHAVTNLVWAIAASLMLLMAAHSAFLGIAGEATPAGYRVTAIVPGSPAELAAVEVGDLLRKVDAEPVVDREQFRRLIRGKQPGQTIVLELVRDNRPLRVEATLRKRKELEQP